MVESSDFHFEEKTMREAIGIKRLQAPKHDQEDFAQLVPPWLTTMYRTVYYAACITHPDTKKNDLDRFCIDCIRAFCYHCLPAHARHTYVKIRRYVYCEVINKQDLCKLFDCSGIQAYHTNKTKVLFLKQRSQQQILQLQQSQPNNSRDHSCIICQRSLQDVSLYCSIACKVTAIYRGENKEESIHDRHNLIIVEKSEGLKTQKGYDKEGLLPQSSSSPKRQKVRKGVALRAPLF
ncbi:protein RGF1 INDUCIBLE TRANSCRIPTION FACTOR 1-like [Rhododendron vialii]|uniref:protein RGF1 INDUCIBLE TRANSCRIPTION FACTOR 1-like n=1 Tax=Rhododendron vialii TaxID=182163 RepID=UPI00265DBF3C|nr:protein RGF1 INDUCIBLE TRANSCRIPTION FACTOR 1-like [Rhododendron vialii]